MAKEKKAKKEKAEKEPKERVVTGFEKEIRVLIVVVVAALFLLSYFHKAGIIGELLSNLAFGMIGLLAYLLPVFLVVMTLFYMANKDNERMIRKCICVCLMSVVMMAFFQLLRYQNEGTVNIIHFFKQSASDRSGGGLIGGLLANILAICCGELGAYLILFALLAVGFMYMTEKLLFHSLKHRSKGAYEKMRERAEIMATERAQIRAREEELEGLEDWEEEPETLKSHLPFFNFRKEAQKEAVEEAAAEEIEEKELEETAEEGVSGEEIEEAVAEDPLSDIVIHRAEDALDDAEKEELEDTDQEHVEAVKEVEEDPYENLAFEDMPIHMQEITQKFSDMENFEEKPLVLEESSADDISEDLIENIEAGLSQFAENFDIQKGEEGAGVVMDAVEEISEQSPEAAMQQLTQPIGAAQTVLTDTMENNLKPQASSNKATKEEQEQVLQAVAKTQKKKKKYIFPSPDLLTKPERSNGGMSDEALKENAKKLQDTLESFGVGAKVTNVSCGPTVTRFELQPDQGVKVSKITALTDDIKLNMAAEEIRIEAPIPGKAAVGIEVPNDSTSMVHFRDLVENAQFKKHKSKLSFAVGKDIGGQVVVTDIAKMPHLLIAGATGSGKSVCINTLIMSILYKAHPDDVKLIMVDPKVVELSCYRDIPHLLIPVVTDPKKASAALQWAVQEMTERYKKFAELGVREIGGYNDRIKAVEYAEDPRFEKMPQIVIIIDELADLMMVASKEVEDSICRLAQLARAAGIHLVIATQRPSVNVITGLIKANVPSRIAFSVSSVVDSRTILDGAGAEKLLGKGDMLFYPSGFPKPVRVQGAFVSDDEVNAVVEFIKNQNDDYVEEASKESSAMIQEVSSGTGVPGASNENDDYFEEAGRFIIEKNKASIGMLQRVYKIGFNRAARIMDQLCAAGVVGPEEGTKPRRVLMTMEEFEEKISG